MTAAPFYFDVEVYADREEDLKELLEETPDGLPPIIVLEPTPDDPDPDNDPFVLPVAA